MNFERQVEQLEDEIRSLQQFAEGNEILSVERVERNPQQIRLIFQGIGLGPGDTLDDEVEPRDRHECDVHFTSRYPDDPPQLRWQTPIYHPNLSSSGFVDLDDVGCSWEADPSLTTLCECIWNTIRMARVDLSDVKNMTAKGWLERQTEFELPLDKRELRVSVHPRPENIVHYQRRDGTLDLVDQKHETLNAEPVYIGEEMDDGFVQVEIVEPEKADLFRIRDDTSSGQRGAERSDRDKEEMRGAEPDAAPPRRESVDRESPINEGDLFFIGDEESEDRRSD